MPLQSSGQISFSQINLEMGRASTSQLAVNDTALRLMINNSASATAVQLNNAYNKTYNGTYSFSAPATNSTGFYMWHSQYDSSTGRAVVMSGSSVNYTTDGINWTAGTYPTTSNQALYYKKLSDGYYYVGHISGYFYTSATGIDTWTAITPYQSITYNQDILLQGGNYIYATSNGLCTSTVRAPTSTGQYTLRASINARQFAVNPNTGRIAAVVRGGTYGAYTTEIHTSDDNGVTWTSRSSYNPAGGYDTEPTGIIWNGTEFVSTGWTITWPGQSMVNGFVIRHGSDGTGQTFSYQTNSSISIGGIGYDSTNNVMIASGNGGRLITSKDGGDSWTQQVTGTSQSLSFPIWMPSIGKLLVYGNYNTTFLTGTYS